MRLWNNNIYNPPAGSGISMYIPKRYGESKLEQCPFCGKQATTLNRQKIPVCVAHKDSYLDDLKCACGSYLDTKIGKYGVYFSCMKCGNINMKKALELNPPKGAASPAYKMQTRARDAQSSSSDSSESTSTRSSSDSSYSTSPSYSHARSSSSRSSQAASSASSLAAAPSSASSKGRQKQKENIVMPDDPRYFG
jgi:hypothetical protein